MFKLDRWLVGYWIQAKWRKLFEMDIKMGKGCGRWGVRSMNVRDLSSCSAASILQYEAFTEAWFCKRLFAAISVWDGRVKTESSRPFWATMKAYGTPMRRDSSHTLQIDNMILADCGTAHNAIQAEKISWLTRSHIFQQRKNSGSVYPSGLEAQKGTGQRTVLRHETYLCILFVI